MNILINHPVGTGTSMVQRLVPRSRKNEIQSNTTLRGRNGINGSYEWVCSKKNWDNYPKSQWFTISFPIFSNNSVLFQCHGVSLILRQAHTMDPGLLWEGRKPMSRCPSCVSQQTDRQRNRPVRSPSSGNL